MGKWEMVRLGDVCEVLDNLRVPITASERKAGIYPYYGANGIQDYVDNYIFDDELVLLAEDGGNFGSKDKPIAYRVSGKCWVNNHAHVLKPRNMLNVDYLCYSIMFYDVMSLISGTTRAKLNQAAMRKMTIPLPPLDAQHKIADVLDRAGDLIEKRKAQIEKLDLLVKSQFVEMFGDPVTNPKGWESKRISDVCTVVSGSTPSTGNSEYWNGNIKWITPAEIGDDSYVIYDTQRHITDKAGLKPMPAGTVILSSRAPIGKVAIAGVEMCCNQGFKNLICSPLIHNEYLFRYLKGQTKQLNELGRGATFKEISKPIVEGIMLPLPPLPLQHRFADFVAQVETQKSQLQQSLASLELNYKSLMQKCFSGEVF